MIPKLDVAGSSPVSRSKINKLATLENEALHCTPLRCFLPRHPNNLPFPQNCFFQLLGRCCSVLDRSLRVLLDRHAYAVTPLVSRHLWIERWPHVARRRICVSRRSHPEPFPTTKPAIVRVFYPGTNRPSIRPLERLSESHFPARFTPRPRFFCKRRELLLSRQRAALRGPEGRGKNARRSRPRGGQRPCRGRACPVFSSCLTR